MSKEDKKKKALSPVQVKQLEDLAALSKSYKSTCKRLGTPIYSPILQDISACTEAIQPLSKVACQGYGVDYAGITALLEVLQGYAACRGLAFLGCTFGDEALQAVSRLLQNGCGKWWTGPRLQLLEIRLQPSDQVVNGGSATQNKASTAQRQHSGSIAAVRPPKLEVPPAAATASVTAAPVAGTPGALPLPATGTSPTQPAAAMPSAQSSAAAMQPATPSALATSQPASASAAAVATAATPRPVAAAMHAAAAMGSALPSKLSKSGPKAAPAPPTIHQQLEGIHVSSDSVHHELVPPAALPVPFAVSTLMQPGPLFLGGLSDTSLDSSTVLPQTRQTTGNHSKQGVSGVLSAQQSGVTELWQSSVWGPGTAHSFGPEALTALSAAIGTVGCQLAVLTLCHTDLGDAGMHQLCKGIGRCSTLQELRLPFCNIGVKGVTALAEALSPPNPQASAKSDKPVLPPKLTLLDLQGNAFGGDGLAELCPGVAACTSLAELNLRAVGITDEHQEAVRLFANIAGCHTTLQSINLDGNLIGDAGAALMLTTLQAKPEIWSLCITRYISRQLMSQFIEQLAANQKAHMAKKKRGARKKKAK